MEIRAPGKKPIMLGLVTPNAQTARWYRDALTKAIVNMSASYEYWIRAKYRNALAAGQDQDALPDPDMAQDANVRETVKRRTDDLYGELGRLRTYWGNYFEKFARKLAEQATQRWYDDNANSWGGKLKRAGFDIEMQLTKSQRTILQAKVPENVALIRSIQQDYHTQIEGIVSRSFLKGRDLATMAEEITKRGKVSKSRAALIARDQSNKATAQMNAARQKDLGLVYATWIHSSAGKEPRHNHVKAGREQWVFNTQEGIDFGDGFGHVLPGEAINCRCGSRTIIPALGRGDIEGPQDLDAVTGFPGAYKAKPGKSAGPKMKQDVTKTRLPGEAVKYS